MMQELLDKCRGLRDLAPIAEALVRYSVSLGIGSFVQKGQRFVADPNFVTFEVHFQRANNLTISLRGNPSEFLALPELPLKKSQNGYSEIKVTSASQLLAAASYIARAKLVFERGRRRVPKTPKLVET